MRFFGELLEGIGLLLPPWVLGPLLLLLALLALPGWLHSTRNRQIRSALRRAAASSDPQAQAEAEAQALGLAAGHPRRLVGLIEEAWRLNRAPLARRVLDELARDGRAPHDVARLEAKMRPEPPRITHPEEAALVVRRLLEDGVPERAREHLAAALQRFPEDAELQALRAELPPPSEIRAAAPR